MSVNSLEESLKGGYNGLYGEVVTSDCYRLKSVKKQPDVIIDIGGNVGVFARYARTIFPDAVIVSVEPNPDNLAVYEKFTHDLHTMCIPAALGKGKIYHGLTACNGSGETYLSSGLGYPEKQMDAACGPDLEVSQVSTVTLQEVLQSILFPGDTYLLKIDCEGAENCIWQDPEAMEVLRGADYLCMELHWYALSGNLSEEVKAVTLAALKTLEETHHCELDGVHFWATKR